jgi:hypothetical protein
VTFDKKNNVLFKNVKKQVKIDKFKNYQEEGVGPSIKEGIFF